MTFTKWATPPGWMDNTKLAWYFDKNGIFLHTKPARRIKDRGAWQESDRDSEGGR